MQGVFDAISTRVHFIERDVILLHGAGPWTNGENVGRRRWCYEETAIPRSEISYMRSSTVLLDVSLALLALRCICGSLSMPTRSRNWIQISAIVLSILLQMVR